MKVVFVSNYFNHHQKPFSDAMDKLTEGNYHFIATEVMSQERKNMGWGMEQFPDYVVQNFTSEEARTYAQELIDEADVVIIGSAPNKLIKNRLKNKKLVFYYSERIYKKPSEWYKLPLRMVRHYWRFKRHKNVYLLCASAYTAADYKKTFCFKNKAYKWGYFTDLKQYEDVPKLIEKKKKNSLLWVARLIPWKHPEVPVKIAKRLKEEGYEIDLTMVGNGPLEAKLHEYVNRIGAQEYVHVLGAMNPKQVREQMEKAEIFLFTSDRNEGWGAVLNESMNSGCTVVASHMIGSVPFLIEDKENGLIYQDGNLDDLYAKVKWLLDHAKERKELGEKAYQTVEKEWNAENAAKRFLVLAQKILNGDKKANPFEKGVCSKAEILKDNWS